MDTAAGLGRFRLKMDRRGVFAPGELDALLKGCSAPKPFAKGTEIVAQESKPRESIILLEGFLSRVSIMSDGAQQITEVHVPGDTPDLHSFILRRMDHSIMGLTAGRISNVPHEHLRRVTDRFPNLTRNLWRNTLVDAAIHRQWIVSLSRRSAHGRFAHFLCEMALRFNVVGLQQDLAFDLPLGQTQIGEILGLSRSHVNLTLQALRKAKLVDWTDGRVTIQDWDGLVEAAEFDPTYLQLERAEA